MEANEILELVRAGFTKEDILSMTKAGADAGKDIPADPEPEKETEPDPAPVDNTGDKKKDPATSVSSKESSEISNLTAKMDEMIKVMQASNRDSVNNEFKDTPQTADMAIKEFLGGI